MSESSFFIPALVVAGLALAAAVQAAPALAAENACFADKGVPEWLSDYMKDNDIGDIRPLTGSNWAAAHPGVLPFEKCAFVPDDSPRPLAADAAFIVGVDTHAKSMPDNVNLFCWSEKLKLGFTVPVEIGNTHGVGLSIGVGAGFAAVHIRSSTLEDRKLSDFFGTFSGFGWNLKAIVGGGEQWLKHDGFKISVGDFGLGIGLDIGHHSVTIKPRERLGEGEVDDSFLAYRSCDKRADLGATFVDFGKIGGSVFERDAAIEQDVQSAKSAAHDEVGSIPPRSPSGSSEQAL